MAQSPCPRRSGVFARRPDAGGGRRFGAGVTCVQAGEASGRRPVRDPVANRAGPAGREIDKVPMRCGHPDRGLVAGLHGKACDERRRSAGTVPVFLNLGHGPRASLPGFQSMIPKSGNRFSDKIMLKRETFMPLPRGGERTGSRVFFRKRAGGCRRRLHHRWRHSPVSPLLGGNVTAGDRGGSGAGAERERRRR